MKYKSELVLPGGDLTRAKIAFLYGADAVYIGLDKYSLRKAEVRFSLPEIKEVIELAHSMRKKLYVTFNIFAHNKHLSGLTRDMAEIAGYLPDAFIISDPGIVAVAKKVAPDIPIHLSTQANSVNFEAIRYWKEQGIKRIVLARELTIEEVREISKSVPEIELETFVHGAMCISYSGRCLLSAYMTGREANLGDCAQPCRWDYKLYVEEKMRPGEYYPVEENSEGTAIMSSRDLRLIRYLPDILKAGVRGLKVEGRNKSEYYLAVTARAYRKALDLLEKDKYAQKEIIFLEKELEKVSHRAYTTGFLFSVATSGEIAPRNAKNTFEYIGLITDNNEVVVKNKISVGDEIEIITPKKTQTDQVKKILVSGHAQHEVNPGKKDQVAKIILSQDYPRFAMLRKKISS